MDPFAVPEPTNDAKPGGFHTLLFLMLFSIFSQVVGGCIQAGKTDRKHEEILGEIEKLKRSIPRP